MDEKVIHLTQGFVAIVSAADYERLKKISWHVHRSGGSGRKLGKPYARSNINGKKIYMHRFIASPEDNLQVDHRNGQTLDNRRENLQPVTNEANQKRKIKPAKKAKRPLTLQLL